MDTPPGTFWQSFLTKPLETIFGYSGIGQLIIYTLRFRFPFIYKSQKRTRQGARGVDQVMEAREAWGELALSIMLLIRFSSRSW